MRERWSIGTLGSVCQIKPPKKEAKERLSGADLVSFVPMKDLGVCQKKLTLSKEKTLDEVVSGYTYFADNDVLLAKITPCFENGKLGIAKSLKNGVGFGSSEYIVFRSNGAIDPEFLFYFLSQNCFRDTGASVMTGAVGHKRVPKEFIENYSIPIPPSPEQKRIVAILDEAFTGIDKAMANAEKNLTNTRELFESYLNDVFTQKGDGWVEGILGDFCKKVEYGTSSKSKQEGSVPVLRMGNIQNGKFSWDSLVYTDNVDEIEKYLLKNNDVLFNRTNSPELVGKAAIYREEKPAIFAGYLIRIHRKEAALDAEFLNYYLNSALAREYGKTVMSGSVNQANINGTKLKQYPIAIPSCLETQREIVDQLNKLSSATQCLEAIYQQKLDSLAELKQSILQKAFAGELTNNTSKGVAA